MVWIPRSDNHKDTPQSTSKPQDVRIPTKAVCAQNYKGKDKSWDKDKTLKANKHHIFGDTNGTHGKGKDNRWHTGGTHGKAKDKGWGKDRAKGEQGQYQGTTDRTNGKSKDKRWDKDRTHGKGKDNSRDKTRTHDRGKDYDLQNTS